MIKVSEIALEWLLRSAFICFLLQALTGALLTLHYEPSLRPAMTEGGKPIVMLEITQSFRHKPTKTRFTAHDILFAEYDTATKAPFYEPDTLRTLSRVLTHVESNALYLPNAAYLSVEQGIMRSADFGALVRGIHASAATMAVSIFFLWLGICLLAGRYTQMPLVHWAAGIVLIALTFGTSVVGYILPMNMRSVAALDILLSALGAVPLVGKWLVGLLQGASVLALPTLVRLYALHILLIPAVLILCWFVLRKGISWREKWAQYFLLGVGIVWLCVISACFLPALPTNAAILFTLPADFTHVMATPQNAQPEWYALGVAALLKMLPAWGVSVSAVMWLLALGTLPLVERYSLRTAFVIRCAVGAVLLGLCALTLWELQWYAFPAVALAEEHFETVVVVSVLSVVLAGALIAWLRVRE